MLTAEGESLQRLPSPVRPRKEAPLMFSLFRGCRLPAQLLAAGLGLGLPALGRAPEALPSPQEMAAADTDVWGEASLRQPDGPSYEFFADLLPPLRYVNTDF